jgi:hypothetical protein
MGGQPGKPKPPGNPPVRPEPQEPKPIQEPPTPIPVPPVERPPVPMRADRVSCRQDERPGRLLSPRRLGRRRSSRVGIIGERRNGAPVAH